MTPIKYVGTEPRTLPWEQGRLVLPGQVVEVADPAAYLCQDIWEKPAKPKPRKRAAKKAAPVKPVAVVAIQED